METSQSGRDGLFWPRAKKNPKQSCMTELHGDISSCMETRNRCQGKLEAFIHLNPFVLQVEYVLFIWYLESYTHSIIYPLFN